jgi:23S rRNA (cytidine2498-2'-O)-methyltransferase|tara:strand:- start:232 stop:1188 length:957 start_codon:yes stop_codon:yes gene_type:complete
LASREILDFIPGATIERLSPDFGIVAGASLADLRERCESGDLMFVRHLMNVDIRTNVNRLLDEVRVLSSGISDRVSLQVWKSPQNNVSLKLVREAIRRLLRELGSLARHPFSRHGLAVYLTNGSACVGITEGSAMLTSWPGGQVRLARDVDQISRSEFKLEELFASDRLRVYPKMRILDLGASPGGWTRQFRRRNCLVWAVDPGRLADALMGDGHVVHVRTTAGPFIKHTDQIFDLLACDMRMTVDSTVETLIAGSRLLTHKGQLVATLKLGKNPCMARLRSTITKLSKHYDLSFARNLFHNGNEVTVVGMKQYPREA